MEFGGEHTCKCPYPAAATVFDLSSTTARQAFSAVFKMDIVPGEPNKNTGDSGDSGDSVPTRKGKVTMKSQVIIPIDINENQSPFSGLAAPEQSTSVVKVLFHHNHSAIVEQLLSIKVLSSTI